MSLQTGPAIAGYDYIQKLGSGSAATVYLYHQRRPERQVAIKVSKTTASKGTAQDMRHEANLMAQFSEHPYILSLHAAGVSPEGFGYMVVDYVKKGSCKDLIHLHPLGIDETLSLGIAIASALVETHRRGILHRDIKPSNILISEQGLPMLSDFGISTSIYQAKDRAGFSIPWAPPEILTGHSRGSESADIYSLGATLFACLCGRSPYEYGHHPSTQQELAWDIVNKPPPRLQIPGLPGELERSLAKALSKNPEDRYPSALEFAHALQGIQRYHFGHCSPLVVKGIEQYPKELAKDKYKAASSTSSGASAEHRSWKKPVALTLSWLLSMLAIAALFIQLFEHGMDSRVSKDRAEISQPKDPTRHHGGGGDDVDVAAVPSPQNLRGNFDNGKATFSWTNPDPKNGDKYAWTLLGNRNEVRQEQTNIVQETQVTIGQPNPGQTCIEVSIVRADRQMSTKPNIACVDNP